MSENCSNKILMFSLNGMSLPKRRPEIAMPKRYKNRPALIRRAIYSAWNSMDELSITISGVAVLQALIASGVDTNDPLKPVYAKKATIARMAQVSESSVYRTLNTLEEKGLIIRLDQQQRLDGSLAIAQISLTEKLLRYLQLDMLISQPIDNSDPEEQSDTDNDSADVPSLVTPIESVTTSSETGATPDISDALTDGLKDGLGDATYVDKQKVDRRADLNTKPSVQNQSTERRFERIGKYTLPVELVWLVQEKRLSPPQIFKLMKLAKSVPGQTLTNYVELRRARLKELETIHDCYRFLKKLIDDQVDAKFLVAQQHRHSHRNHRNEQKKRAEQERYLWLRDRDGQTYVEPCSGKSYTINARNGLVSVGFNGQPVSTTAPLKVNGRFIDRVSNGELKRFVPPALDRTFPRGGVMNLLREAIKNKQQEVDKM